MPYCGRRGGPPRTKLSLLINAYALISLGKGTKRDQGTAHLTADFAPKRTKRIFYLSTSRRAVYCPAALESRGVAHCGRLR
jgi:hypothetical protein